MRLLKQYLYRLVSISYIRIRRSGKKCICVYTIHQVNSREASSVVSHFQFSETQSRTVKWRVCSPYLKHILKSKSVWLLTTHRREVM